MLYTGLDVHSRQSSLCILNSGGGTVKQIQIKGPRSAVFWSVTEGTSRVSSSSGIEQWLNRVAPALMRDVAITTCDIA